MDQERTFSWRLRDFVWQCSYPELNAEFKKVTQAAVAVIVAEIYYV